MNIIELQKRFLPFTPGFVILNFNSLFYFYKKGYIKILAMTKILFKKRWSPQNFWVIKKWSYMLSCNVLYFWHDQFVLLMSA